MSKKRVHEIAKELKEKHGIEFDNKQVVTELVSLGYDVKSHSSSLEDDQAVAAVQKIVDKLKPKAAPAPVAAKGFVVRRKVGDNVVATAAAPPTAPIVREAPPAVVEAPVAPPQVEAPVETAPVAEPVVNMPAATDAPVEAPVAKPPEVPVVPAAADPVAAAPAVTPAAVEAAAIPPARASAPRARASAPRPGAVAVTPAAAPPAVAVPPMVRTGVGPRASAPRPGVTVRPPLAGATATRAPIGLGIAAIRAQQSAASATPGAPAPVRTVPTATQAVVVSRPLIP
ncbi:MAG: translation initiation factor IF-2 N-terminal domain-containing protein, partial [Archangium sp.]